jgi:hypothetical protein
MSLSNFQTVYTQGIYTDLLRQFIQSGHKVFIIVPFERRNGEKERVICEEGATIVKVRIWNMQKTNGIEKGISMLTIDRIFTQAIKKYFYDVKFDLVLYSTPPITLLNTVKYVKKRDKANTYLLLKDIFPQNAVDLGMMTKFGFKGLIYKYFRRKEKKLYNISDYIGCMSPANVNYIIRHNQKIKPHKIEVCPNSIELIDKSISFEIRNKIRTKYHIPLDKKVFVYGGNLGKPQSIPFIIKCMKECSDIENVYFLIVGDGTEYKVLENYVKMKPQRNLKLMRRLPSEDYDILVAACDVGMIFLDYRFTIPNFPSRLLSYMQAKLPVLACVDKSTDIGDIIEQAGFGWKSYSNDPKEFAEIIKKVETYNLRDMGEKSYQYLMQHYSVTQGYKKIIGHFSDSDM